VKGFQNKQIAIIEDEYGFDVPVLISECVVVESAGNEKLGMTATSEVEKEPKNEGPKTNSIVVDDEPEETPEGEKITTCIAFLPVDAKNMTTTTYESYFVNDSNYFLYYNYMSRENNAWRSRSNGLIEPNTKIFLEEFDKSRLNEIEKICVQFIAFKHRKSFGFKNPVSAELRIDTVKFYKLHAFQENDYFDENALVYYITRNDIPERDMLINAGDLENALREKERIDNYRRPRIQKIEKKDKNEIIEVDLHIDQLLDSTAGMSNADMLEYQLKKFNEVMTENLHHKNQKIVFIHGKGDGVLKNALLKEIKTKYKHCVAQDASFQEYGFGATMVIIK
jgi:hypothetical protein